MVKEASKELGYIQLSHKHDAIISGGIYMIPSAGFQQALS